MKQRNKMKKALAVCTALLMLACSLSACGGASKEGAKASSTLSGKLSLAGSTSMEKLCEAMSESFMNANPDVTVTVEYTGSSAGVESLLQGSVDVGNASRKLKDGETEKGAVENVVAIDGIAVITDKANTVSNLTTEQLADIYTGAVRNWSELGGADEAIVVIGREAGSGTRGAFEELLKVEDACRYAQELDSTGAVLAKTAATPGAIGYISLDAVDASVQCLSLNGVAAAEETIAAGEYPLSRPFVMATAGEVSAQNELVQAWFAYLASEEGQQIIQGVGLILPRTAG
ncbi:MAG: phosphate ABC transporter substrate-binding protein [Oscillospiraceae bacterium]|nr:phosphate ABC transporter substrate-binding protein [Oscillospiraceae bacterium]